MIQRIAGAALTKLTTYYPIVAVLGARQVGKTTLVRTLFPQKPYVSLEDLDQRAFAKSDPRRFLAQFPEGAILDEVQRVPELFSYLQTLVDLHFTPGAFILTGSQQFHLLEKITQSLAGRVGILHLFPLSYAELCTGGFQNIDLETLLFQGGYPSIYDRSIPPSIWFSDYVSTYIERDIRDILQVRDVSVFHQFIRMCAMRTGQLLNLSALAADCGISHNTAKSWLSVLETSSIVTLLHPYHANISKRLTKSPKLYFLDTGLAAMLAGITAAKELVHHPMRGHLFETWVIAEFLKYQKHNLLSGELLFFRENNQYEIDLLCEIQGKYTAIECKAGQTIASDWCKKLLFAVGLIHEKQGHIVYAGDLMQQRENCTLWNWQNISTLMQQAFPFASDSSK